MFVCVPSTTLSAVSSVSAPRHRCLAILNLSGDLGKDVLDVGVGFVACSPPESECFMMLGRGAMEDDRAAVVRRS